MSNKAPKFVVTGVHVQGVPYVARVLVRPDRLDRLRNSILITGHVTLKPGETLEIDTRVFGEPERAVSVTNLNVNRLRGACLMSWDGGIGNITIYADDPEHVAVITNPVTTALTGGGQHEFGNGEVFLDSTRLDLMKVGNVTVHFDNDPEKELADPEKEPCDEAGAPRLKRPPGSEVSHRFETRAERSAQARCKGARS